MVHIHVICNAIFLLFMCMYLIVLIAFVNHAQFNCQL